MASLKLVLIAILLVFVCAFVAHTQGEINNEVAEFSQNEMTKEQSERWRWHDDESAKEAKNVEEEQEVKVEEKKAKKAFPPCRPASSGKSTTAPTTKPTTAPTTRPTNAPTTRPTSAPATNAPTTRPTNAPTTRPTSAPTTAPTPRPTSAPTTAPTPRPTSAPATNAPTTRPTTAPSTGLCDVVPTSSEPVKMLLPLYVYPGSSWDQIVTAASKIDIIAIINPNSGPTSTPGSTYTTYMNRLNAAGVEQIGYVYTSYGERAISLVKADIDTYASKFAHINGIFFDEASNSANKISYYSELYNYVLSKGFVHSILNPGVQPDEGYLAISTSIVIFEDYGNKVTSATNKNYVKCASSASAKQGYKYKFAGIAHTAASSSISSYISNFQQRGMGLVYVTDGAGGCCTYNTMPSYFSAEVSAIAALNA